MDFLQRLFTFITRRRPRRSTNLSTTETHPQQAAASPNSMFYGVRTVNIFGGTFIVIGKPQLLASSLCTVGQLSISTVDWPRDSNPWRREYAYHWNSDRRYQWEKANVTDTNGGTTQIITPVSRFHEISQDWLTVPKIIQTRIFAGFVFSPALCVSCTGDSQHNLHTFFGISTFHWRPDSSNVFCVCRC